MLDIKENPVSGVSRSASDLSSTPLSSIKAQFNASLRFILNDVTIKRRNLLLVTSLCSQPGEQSNKKNRDGRAPAGYAFSLNKQFIR